MTEAELRRRFEELTLAPQDFSHREHVRMAWIYLAELPLLDVLRVFPERLKRFAISIGKPDLYHETITWAFLMIISERMEDSGRTPGWDAFAAANADLLGDSTSVLRHYYRDETLAAATARRSFRLPDRLCRH